MNAYRLNGVSRLTGWDNGAVRLLVLLLVFAVIAPFGVLLAVNRFQDKLSPVDPPVSTVNAVTSGGEATATGKLHLAKIGSFKKPVYIAGPPGDTKRLFVVEQSGRIQLLVGGKRKKKSFLDITGETTKDGEQGLLSMAFAPDYATSGKFYVDFTDRDGNTRIQEFKRSSNPDRANKASRRQLLKIKQPFPNHNGGQLQIGPDRLLYIGMGDGGDAGDPGNRAQDRDSLLGKLLRIDPRPSGGRPYTVPPSNPFVGRGGRDEIYSTGLRNPWRFSFDRNTGDLYIADVGQGDWEEVDYAPNGKGKGVDWGWSCREGKHSFDNSRSCPNAVGPIIETPHSAGNCSITGGYVVRDPSLPSLAGNYVYGDFCLSKLSALKVVNGEAQNNRSLKLTAPALSSFGEDAAGRIYVASLNGPVYRLVD